MFNTVTDDVLINWLNEKRGKTIGYSFENGYMMVSSPSVTIREVDVNMVKNITVWGEDITPIITINCSCKPNILYSEKLDMFTIRYYDSIMKIISVY